MLKLFLKHLPHSFKRKCITVYKINFHLEWKQIRVISIITVNFNVFGLQDTLELCRSVKDQVKSICYDLIVVDNGSKVDEVAQIKQIYPWVQVIRSEKNLFFRW